MNEKYYFCSRNIKFAYKMKSYAYFFGYYYYFAPQCEAGSCV